MGIEKVIKGEIIYAQHVYNSALSKTGSIGKKIYQIQSKHNKEEEKSYDTRRMIQKSMVHMGELKLET